jgi:hypothetical protein
MVDSFVPNNITWFFSNHPKVLYVAGDILSKVNLLYDVHIASQDYAMHGTGYATLDNLLQDIYLKKLLQK